LPPELKPIAVLDLLCQGRVRFGMGRGLARREFEAFRGTMDESRERLDEASSMIVNALRNGFMEGEGRFYKQPKVAIRPRRHYSFDGRLDAVASSEDAVASAARLGAHMVLFSDRPWPMRVPAIARYRALFQQCHGVPAPPLMSTDFCLCGPSVSEAEAHARRSMGTLVESNVHHYEFLGDHFAQVQGYDAYAQKATIAKQNGLGGAIDGFMQAAI
jgi:alkanesulfonate monooxygenase SsuD/methylene tetrahydromethanopterin reductase-like flavin-dependent oxidoreductase (luciferase family)